MVPVDYLKSLPLLEGLDDMTSQSLAYSMVAKSYKQRDFVIKQGDNQNDLFFLLNGQLQVFDTNASGRDVGLSVIEEGEFFGELAVIDGKPRSASVMAIAPSVVLLLPCAVAREFFFNNPKGSQRMMIWLAGRLRQASSQQALAASGSAKARILAVLTDLAVRRTDGSLYIEKLPTQHQIAIMANLARETVARGLAQLKAEGCIDFGKGRARSASITGPSQLYEP
ncbi:MAG: Crp/Fnr family transcriptional regulator [Burkholderiaceae bacterium]|jgi:CRP/FNR family transcriptional regulator, cyclic AMP receptor protein|nr:Crp/Fnr family transcriptional regulator [Burkholderiaceae bacterium]MDP4949632.1 Crp/Fnr family transcriptional regulator [Burkholderiaceae bacterium]MDP5127627.1 Crp/Fnr family transcriptional regulator [Burkholderiaceae bacterium]